MWIRTAAINGVFALVNTDNLVAIQAREEYRPECYNIVAISSDNTVSLVEDVTDAEAHAILTGIMFALDRSDTVYEVSTPDAG